MRQRDRERVLLLSDKRISNTSEVLITLNYAFLQIIKSKQTKQKNYSTEHCIWRPKDTNPAQSNKPAMRSIFREKKEKKKSV